MSEQTHDISLVEVTISQPVLTTDAFIPVTVEFTGALAEVMLTTNEVWVEANALSVTNVDLSLAEIITKLTLEGNNPPMRGASRLNTAIGIGIGM